MEINKIGITDSNFASYFTFKGDDVIYFAYIKNLRKYFLKSMPSSKFDYIRASEQDTNIKFVEPEVFFLLHGEKR